MTVVSGKRRGRGEDSIFWDDSKDRYVGVVSLGYSPSGTRVRKKVMGRTKTEVREKLKELHQQVENGLRPRRHYTVNDALDDWLANGLDGLAASTVTLYRRTIAEALREELGTVKLTSLNAGAVQKALANIASRRSTRTVQIAHNVLVRAIRHAERDDLVRQNVAALVKPPKGQSGGRPSKALTLEQSVALMSAARGTRLEAYIVLSLLTGLRTEEIRALRWDHIVAWVGGQWQPVAEAGFDRKQLAVFVWRAERAGATRKRRSRAGRWRCRADARRHFESIGCGRRRTGSLPGRCGRTTGWCSPQRSGRRWMTTTYGGCSGRSRRMPGWGPPGCRGSFGIRSCRCCRLIACRWRRSRCWPGTSRRPRPNWCTGIRSCLP